MNATLAAAAAITKPWAGHGTRLIVVTVIGIAIIVVLIVVLKMHPFLSLILGSAFVGLAAPVPLQKIVTNFELGVGTTLSEVGLLIALGAMLGKLWPTPVALTRSSTSCCPRHPRRWSRGRWRWSRSS